MTPQQFKRNVDWIIDNVFPLVGVGKNHFLTIEYLGGEVLLVPELELEEAVQYARSRIKPLVSGFRDGVQSNLIGSPRRIQHLHDLFGKNLGTSWDPYSGQRTVRGKRDLYDAVLNRSLLALDTQSGFRPGRVLVVDAHTAPHLSHATTEAIQGGYDLVLRPVFQGGSDGINPATLSVLEQVFVDALTLWLRSDRRVRIEPFATLFERRVRTHPQRFRGDTESMQRTAAVMQYCPFQSDCAFKSLSLDPDGSLYICQEMADSGHYPLGNAAQGLFYKETWEKLSRRSAHLDKSCRVCQWRHSCMGGCMNEAIAHHGDPFAKTDLCDVWKALFRTIDAYLVSEENTTSANQEVAFVTP